MPTLLLSWRYVASHKLKTAILAACIALTAYLPITVHALLAEFERAWTARAAATPLVAGARGSRFDLTLHALYFSTKPPETIVAADADSLMATDFARTIPIHAGFTARRHPVVGTTLDYFDFRGLVIESGDGLAMLGDCVLGASAARKLGLAPGDRLLTDPDNVFDIAGSYALNMKVAGVFAECGTPDDEAVFVDLKTVWVIAGIGHGHVEVETTKDEGKILAREGQNIVASAAAYSYTEITPENIGSFHFHSERAEMPLTAVVLAPWDEKSGTLLRGRYQGRENPIQIIVPADTVNEMLGLILRARRVLDANVALVTLSTALFLVLTVVLSLRLRRREMEIMFHLGCARWTIFKLQATELLIVMAAGILVAAGLAALSLRFGPRAIQWFLS